MKIGIIVSSEPHEPIDFPKMAQYYQGLGFEGIHFRSPLLLSETLDVEKLRSIHQIAGEMGLFLGFDLGYLNPFKAQLEEDLWALGEGDYCKALHRQLRAAREIGCTEVVGKIAGVNGPYNGRYAFDRFRSDVCWDEQLQAAKNLLLKIRPILADLGLRIDIENHEDLTSQELIRLVEELGPEYFGISLDVANLPVLGEDPYQGSARMAPCTHLAHIKDIFLMPTEKGLLRQIRPAGEGIIHWEAIIPMLYGVDPNIRLLVEDHKGLIQIDLLEPEWREHYPELAQNEIEALLELTRVSRQRVEQGISEAPEIYEAIPYRDQKIARITQSLAHLTRIRSQYGLWDR